MRSEIWYRSPGIALRVQFLHPLTKQTKKHITYMKTKLKLALFAILGTVALVANAQDDGGGAPPGGGGQNGGPGGFGRRGHPPVPAIVRALDANHDGIIDSNEIANASAVLKS